MNSSVALLGVVKYWPLDSKGHRLTGDVNSFKSSSACICYLRGVLRDLEVYDLYLTFYHKTDFWIQLLVKVLDTSSESNFGENVNCIFESEISILRRT